MNMLVFLLRCNGPSCLVLLVVSEVADSWLG